MGILLASYALFGSCTDIYDLPEDRDFISEEIKYENNVLEPILGRTNLFSTLNPNNSTLPLKFEIVNARYGDGRPVTDIFQKVPTYEWITEYDGLEKSLAEIEAKRRLVNKSLLEIDSLGRIILWGSSSNELIDPRPADTVLKTQDIRFFDIKITNTGGSRILKDFQLIPWRQRDYSPSTDINPYTGGVAPDPKSPKDPTKQDYILPAWISSNLIGEQTERRLENNADREDIVVYIRKFEGGSGNNLRFKFMAKDGTFINPVKFNETKWDELVHGFNKTISTEYVQYDVAYPIPLTNYRTDYVNGDHARVEFAFSRIQRGGDRIRANFGLDFRIFKQGDWEIIFHFRNDNPKFEDD